MSPDRRTLPTMGLLDITRDAVLAAMAECDAMGRETFLLRYGFHRSRAYHVIHEGRPYDSKAIAGVAHRHAVGRVLTAREFSGGVQTVVPRLRALGFTVEPPGLHQLTKEPTDAHSRLVLIAPSFGSSASRTRAAATLDRKISFLDSGVKQRLRADELEALLQLHPDGLARFWGATAIHDSKFARLTAGDHVLFTGANLLQATGKVGCLLKNPELADLLWTPDPKNGSWSTLYTVLDFERVRGLGYDELRVMAGYGPGDRFQDTRVPSAEVAAALITGLGLDSVDTDEEDELAGQVLADALNHVGERVFEAEGHHTETSEYYRDAALVTLRRSEARLVARYRQSLPDGQGKRLRLAVGWTDLYHTESADLIEAKRSAAHRFVRDALGQLLDYAAHASHPINCLTALFPSAPTPQDIRLLHTYGIDCLFWEGDDRFTRRKAPEVARQRIQAAWSSVTE